MKVSLCSIFSEIFSFHEDELYLSHVETIEMIKHEKWAICETVAYFEGFSNITPKTGTVD